MQELVVLSNPVPYVLAAFVTYCIFRTISRLYLSPLSSIPGPWYAAVTDLWFTWIFVRFRRVRTIDSLLKQYGPIVRVSPNRVVFSDVPAYKQVYGSETKVDKHPMYKTFTISGHDHVFTILDHSRHAARRKLLSSHYTFAHLSRFEPEFHAITARMIELIEKIPRGRPLDTLVLFRHYLIDVNSAHLFDYSSRSLDIYSDHVLKGVNQDALSICINDFPRQGVIKNLFPKWLWAVASRIPCPRWQEFINAERNLWEYVRQRVQQCCSGENRVVEETIIGERSSFITRMLSGKAADALSQEEIIAETTGQIIAGTDTTSTTLSFLLYEISRRGDIATKLQAEVDSVIVDPESIPQNRVLRDLPYLNAVISEGLRIYSAQPSPLDRIVPLKREPLRILGYDLPAGTIVAGQAWSIHREASIFHDPEHFDPDRWLEGVGSTPSGSPSEHDEFDDSLNQSTEASIVASMKSHMFPFAHGPRICLGNNLVLIVLRLVLVTIVRNFEIIAPPETNDQSMEIHDANLIFPVGGRCKLVFVPRAV